MKFYIVTPTFNALSWLQRCIRSVADQSMDGVEVHHHVQDGKSTDGTPDWLHEWQISHTNLPGYTFTFASQKDAGMYDALNKAWSRIPSDADITAHLNSDEQYLPSALNEVAKGFLCHPQGDIALTSNIIVNSQGEYICHKRPIVPTRWISDVSCEIPTYSCFHKVETFIRHGIRFDTRFRSIADMVMYRDLTKLNLHYIMLPDAFTTTFAITGANLGWGKETLKDMEILVKDCPYIGTWFNRNIPFRLSALKRHLKDFFYRAPRSYKLYKNSDEIRTKIIIERPTTHWNVTQLAHSK